VNADIEVIVLAVFTNVGAAFRARQVTPDADSALNDYARYWAALGADSDHMATRCDSVVRKALARLKLTPEQVASHEDLVQQMIARCVQFHRVAPRQLP
jgi:hypothetical protein